MSQSFPLVISAWTKRSSSNLEVTRSDIDARSATDLLKELLTYSGEVPFSNRPGEPESWADHLGRDGTLAAALDESSGLEGDGDPKRLADPVLSPQAALIIAFCRLFRHSQFQLNGFHPRLAEHYSAEILGQRSPPEGPPAPRHRGRALLPSDMERLILDRYPQVDQVRVLAGRDALGAERAGHVLILLGSIGESGAVGPTSEEVRASSRDWLATISSPFAQFHTPALGTTGIDVAVRASFSTDGGGEALAADLRHFLSVPDEHRALPDAPSDSAIRDSIVRFILGLPYVGELADLDVARRGVSCPSALAAGDIRVEAIEGEMPDE